MRGNLLKLYVSFFLILTCTHCYPQKKVKNLVGVEISTDSINAFLKSRIDSLNIPGVSIAIIGDGQVAYHNTLGYANLKKKYQLPEKLFSKVHPCLNRFFQPLS